MKILFIGARLFDDVALYTKKEGITSILTESNSDSPNLKLADVHYIVPRGMEGPKEIALREDVDAVLPLIGIDKPLMEVATLKEELEKDYGIPVIASPPNTIKITGDKLKTKEFFEKNNIMTPEFFKLSENKKMYFPVVLKKPDGQGGSGIQIVSGKKDYEGMMDRYHDAFAEKFVSGTEISIEVLRYKGKTVPLVPVNKGKTTIEGIHPLDKIKTAPMDMEGLESQEIIRKAALIADLLGAEGVIDVDIIYDENEGVNYFIEINTRPSGTRYLTTASTNISPLYELVDMASGKWNVEEVEKRIQKHCALEIPVGDYKTDRNNYRFRDFEGKNSWVIHGPQNFQRITIRAPSIKNAFQTAEELNIHYKKFH